MTSPHSRPDPKPLLAEARAAAALPDQPLALYRALDRALGLAIGHKLFTLAVTHADQTAERVYSNQPDAYPVAGRKSMAGSPWAKHVLVGKRAYLGRTPADIRWAFYDHELIASLGCGSVINLPVLHEGELLGVVNMLHEALWYDERDLEIGAPFAQFLAPALLRRRG
jgi:hypothetical protein